MASGNAINRTWVCQLVDGTPMIDWGNGQVQDILTGDYRPFDEGEFSHVATDRDLELLRRAGRVSAYTSRMVYLIALPEARRAILD